MTSARARRTLHLNAFLMTIGHHESAWRFPESSLLGTWDLKHYVRLAQVAERGKFDSIFFGDSPSLQGDVRCRPVGRLDPTTLLPALVSVTEHIGLVATASTTYNEPPRGGRRRDGVGGDQAVVRIERCRVAPGDYPPGPSPDPDKEVSTIRLLR